VKFGIIMFVTDESMGIVELARAVEERGFESLFLPEHSHIPVEHCPWPGGPELPRYYKRSLDLFTALGAAAAVTSRIQLGTGVCLVMQRDPIQLAKEVATLDQISGGRVLLGVGGGWNREEMADHGTDPSKRWKILRERVLACKAIWTQDEAEFHGEYVDFAPMWSWPKPSRVPPVLVGGDGAGTFERVLEYGDGWMPLSRFAPGAFATRFAELQKLAADRGRPSVPVSLFGAPPEAQVIAECAELGVERCIFFASSAPAEVVLPELDAMAGLMGNLS
jgi:probable F420-dependent oxidoreductase